MQGGPGGFNMGMGGPSGLFPPMGGPPGGMMMGGPPYGGDQGDFSERGGFPGAMHGGNGMRGGPHMTPPGSGGGGGGLGFGFSEGDSPGPNSYSFVLSQSVVSHAQGDMILMQKSSSDEVPRCDEVGQALYRSFRRRGSLSQKRITRPLPHRERFQGRGRARGRTWWPKLARRWRGPAQRGAAAAGGPIRARPGRRPGSGPLTWRRQRLLPALR